MLLLKQFYPVSIFTLYFTSVQCYPVSIFTLYVTSVQCYPVSIFTLYVTSEAMLPSFNVFTLLLLLKCYPISIFTFFIFVIKLGFPFAKILRNFCRTKRKIFSFFVHQFYTKKQQFAQSFTNVNSRKIAQFHNCEI